MACISVQHCGHVFCVFGSKICTFLAINFLYVFSYDFYYNGSAVLCSGMAIVYVFVSGSKLGHFEV